MKTKIIIIRKKSLILFCVIFLFIIGLLLVSYFFKNNNAKVITTSTVVSTEKAIKRDFTGDGKEDLLYISSKNNKYYLEVYSSEKSYFLEPTKKLNTMGSLSSFWPMTLSFFDISRDRKPEIFVQASQDKIPVQHIFSWVGGEFKDVFCSTNNIFGILDSNNNKTPRLVSMNIKDSQITAEQFMLLGSSIKNCTSDSFTVPGINSVSLFIDMIESTGEIKKVYDIFKSNISENDLSLLWQLDKTDYIYELNDAFFIDKKWTTDGKIKELQWTINFRKIKIQGKEEPTQVTMKLGLILEEDKYNISYIKLASGNYNQN